MDKIDIALKLAIVGILVYISFQIEEVMSYIDNASGNIQMEIWKAGQK